jgi:hypothetical protein
LGCDVEDVAVTTMNLLSVTKVAFGFTAAASGIAKFAVRVAHSPTSITARDDVLNASCSVLEFVDSAVRLISGRTPVPYGSQSVGTRGDGAMRASGAHPLNASRAAELKVQLKLARGIDVADPWSSSETVKYDVAFDSRSVVSDRTYELATASAPIVELRTTIDDGAP